jgi:hypothetical protein
MGLSSIFSSSSLATTRIFICKHIVHYDCVDNSRKLRPICPSTDMEIDDLENSGPNNDAQKKRSREVGRSNESGASTKKSSSKKQKISDKDGESSMLKKIIEKLTALSTTTSQSEISNPGNLTDLYNAIVTAEDQNIGTNRDVIQRYYSFGEELENIFDRFKSLYRELT